MTEDGSDQYWYIELIVLVKVNKHLIFNQEPSHLLQVRGSGMTRKSSRKYLWMRMRSVQHVSIPSQHNTIFRVTEWMNKLYVLNVVDISLIYVDCVVCNYSFIDDYSCSYEFYIYQYLLITINIHHVMQSLLNNADISKELRKIAAIRRLRQSSKVSSRSLLHGREEKRSVEKFEVNLMRIGYG